MQVGESKFLIGPVLTGFFSATEEPFSSETEIPCKADSVVRKVQQLITDRCGDIKRDQ